MTRRRDGLAAEDEALRRELDLLRSGSGNTAALALIDHLPGAREAALVETKLGPDPIRMKGLEYLAGHEVDVEDAAKRVRVVGSRAMRRADGVQDHVARRHLERDRVGSAEQLLLIEALHLDVSREVEAGQAEQASVLKRRGVQIDVAIEVRDAEGVGSPVGALVGRVLVPGDRHARVGQLHHERVVDRQEGIPQALTDRREQAGVDRRGPEGRVPVPQHAVGPVVLLAAVDVSVAVAGPLPGDRLPRHFVRRRLERADLIVTEHASNDEEPVSVEPIDLLRAQHPQTSLD